MLFRSLNVNLLSVFISNALFNIVFEPTDILFSNARVFDEAFMVAILVEKGEL